MRKCPFNDCNKQLPDAVFACRKHWFSLNVAERAAVYQCYNQYLYGTINIEELRAEQQMVLRDRGTA